VIDIGVHAMFGPIFKPSLAFSAGSGDSGRASSPPSSGSETDGVDDEESPNRSTSAPPISHGGMNSIVGMRKPGGVSRDEGHAWGVSNIRLLAGFHFRSDSSPGSRRAAAGNFTVGLTKRRPGGRPFPAPETTMDARLIAAGQRAEHYEMAAYGTLVAWGQAMGHIEAAKLLQKTLDEEKAADKKLSGLAEAGINQAAADAAHADEDEEPVAAAGSKPGMRSATLTRR
jgi:hypothetical protein